MKPSEDEKAIQRINELLCPEFFCGRSFEQMIGRVGIYRLKAITKKVLKAMDDMGYHKE